MGGFGIPKLYAKLWWPLFLAMKFTFLFLNLAKIHIIIPKCTEEGGRGGSTGLGNIPKKTLFLVASLSWNKWRNRAFIYCVVEYKGGSIVKDQKF